MLDLLYTLDLKILLFINQILSNPIFDFIMPLFDNVKNWIPFILVFWLVLIYVDKKNRIKLLILVPLVILLGDQIGKIIKDLEFRNRPWVDLRDLVHHLGGDGGKHLSFPSNHALNITSMSVIFSSIYKGYSKYIWFYALLAHKFGHEVFLDVFYPNVEELGWEGAFVKAYGIAGREFNTEFLAFLDLPLEQQLAILPNLDPGG